MPHGSVNAVNNLANAAQTQASVEFILPMLVMLVYSQNVLVLQDDSKV